MKKSCLWLLLLAAALFAFSCDDDDDKSTDSCKENCSQNGGNNSGGGSEDKLHPLEGTSCTVGTDADQCSTTQYVLLKCVGGVWKVTNCNADHKSCQVGEKEDGTKEGMCVNNYCTKDTFDAKKYLHYCDQEAMKALDGGAEYMKCDHREPYINLYKWVEVTDHSMLDCNECGELSRAVCHEKGNGDGE